jgi:hypothetical protein
VVVERQCPGSGNCHCSGQLLAGLAACVRVGTDTPPIRKKRRCGGTPATLTSVSPLHKVLRPSRVTAYDRRDDTRISDDSDDRDRQFFTCVSCGGTAADKPAGPDHADPLVSSGYSQPSHHRLLCPQRRGTGPGDHTDLILAHVLHTEAIRVLLPVATALINERVASFAAALMAGVARKYGGDPDHLAVITATMHDQETGRDRQFLVLHDTMCRWAAWASRSAAVHTG